MEVMIIGGNEMLHKFSNVKYFQSKTFLGEKYV